ncbi:XRE family transcriptional regulator [Amycolatopsis japonica]|uniref:XRE family transcriptional regulator n=1 Tax=Amycolatopsis japonica TaxID=208439 RepID=UPI0037B2050F
MTSNDRLTRAREAMPSRLHPGTSMGRDELSALVREWITKHDARGRLSAFDANHLGKLERGSVRRPSKAVRGALCAILDRSEAELGFSPGSEAQRVSQAISGRSHTDVASLKAVAGVLASVRRLEDVTGPAEVLPTVLSQTSLAERLADEAQGKVRKRAVSLLANLENYLGWLTLSLDHFSDSRRHLERAAFLAVEADDPMRLSTALSFSAYRNVRRGNLTAAASQTEAAARDERTNVSIRAYLNYQRAEILAMNGERNDALSALTLADSFMQVRPAGQWGQEWYFMANRALALSALGEGREASRVAGDAISLMPSNLSNQPLRVRQTARRVQDLL